MTARSPVAKAVGNFGKDIKRTATSPVPRAAQTAAPVQAPMPIFQRPEFTGFVDYLKGQREGDLAAGKTFAGQYFGAGNPEIQAIINQRKERALGLNPAEVNAMRANAGSEINRQSQTALRQLRGSQAANGIKGGAAIGQAVPIVRAAADARGQAENNIALADMARRGSELSALEGTLTGERAGELGTIFGWAGLGAGDRSGAAQNVLTGDFLNFAKGELAKVPPASSIPQANTGSNPGPWWMNPDWYKDQLRPFGGYVSDRFGAGGSGAEKAGQTFGGFWGKAAGSAADRWGWT